jgi:cytochrome c-type biogenesis protein
MYGPPDQETLTMTLTDRPELPILNPGKSGSEPPEKDGLLRRTGIIAIVLLVIAGVSLGILLTGTTSDTNRPDATVLSQQDITDRLLRTIGGDIEYEVLYTPTWYFEWSARDIPDTGDNAAIGFFLFETVHVGLLPESLPNFNAMAGTESLDVYKIIEVDSSDHHRVTQVLFIADDGPRLLVKDGDRIELTLSGTANAQFGWDLDDSLGAGVLSADAAQIGITSGSLTVAALFAIFGGMLTALSPCLLLLATYYTAVLGGQATQEGGSTAKATRKMMTTALYFILGFTVIYTIGGIFAGYVGNSIGKLDNISAWARPISIVAGIAVVILGIRVAAQANVPMVCKIPGLNKPDKEGVIGSAMMGSTFAVGCLSCFSATVLSALLLYAGATGSPVTGGLIMLTFSATVGFMFLIAAFLVAKAMPLITWVEKARPVIGGISAIVMIALGMLMITYKFHILTGWIFEAWS